MVRWENQICEVVYVFAQMLSDDNSPGSAEMRHSELSVWREDPWCVGIGKVQSHPESPQSLQETSPLSGCMFLARTLTNPWPPEVVIIQ